MFNFSSFQKMPRHFIHSLRQVTNNARAGQNFRLGLGLLAVLLAGGCNGAPLVAGDAGSEVTVDAGLCVPARSGLQNVRMSDAAPYLVHHPASPNEDTPTILFLPGGDGSRDIAEQVYALWLEGGQGEDDFRIIVPYAADRSLSREAGRLIPVLDEVLRCYGGTNTRVHLGGTSNGGILAFQLMLDHPDRFSSLLGAPGYFEEGSPSAWATALTGKRFLAAVGAQDDAQWLSAAQDTHQALIDRGIDGQLLVLPNQGHILDETFDPTVFFDFWQQ